MKQTQRPLKVLKFGGTSLGSVAALERMATIVVDACADHRIVLVVSAVGKTTDQLVALFEGERRPIVLQAKLDALVENHVRLACALLPKDELAGFLAHLEAHVRRLLDQLVLEQNKDLATKDVVLATGERLSVALVARFLRVKGCDAFAQDATDFVCTDATHGNAHVDVKETHRRLGDWYRSSFAHQIPVITGFVGASAAGAVTTLGRGGSDYSAALVASGLQATVLERWTDVDGLYTADPRTDPSAQHLDTIILEEAWAWNHAGRLGMHRKALDPLVAAGIPVHVRSTLQPKGSGTRLLPSATFRHRKAVGL